MIVWIAVAVLALTIAIVIASGGGGTVFGVETGRFAGIAVFSMMALVIGAGVFRQMRGRVGEAIRMAGAWLAILAVVLVGYTYRHDAGDIYRRVVGELVPGTAIEVEGGRVAIARSGNGHFVVDAEINGAPVAMLFDTGASTVVLTPEDAARAGVDVDQLVYGVEVWTANGRTSAAAVLLDTVAVGSISASRVRAVVARPGNLQESLLGMSFLERIGTWRVERDQLILGG